MPSKTSPRTPSTPTNHVIQLLRSLKGWMVTLDSMLTKDVRNSKDYVSDFTRVTKCFLFHVWAVYTELLYWIKHPNRHKLFRSTQALMCRKQQFKSQINSSISNTTKALMLLKRKPLRVHKRGINAILGNQLRMCSNLYYRSICTDSDLVCSLHSAQSMSYHQCSTSLQPHQQMLKIRQYYVQQIEFIQPLQSYTGNYVSLSLLCGNFFHLHTKK